MRVKTKPVEGGHLWRMSRWAPPDPVWVATGHVEAVRDLRLRKILLHTVDHTILLVWPAPGYRQQPGRLDHHNDGVVHIVEP